MHPAIAAVSKGTLSLPLARSGFLIHEPNRALCYRGL